jgi:hypothetical protein
LRILRIVTAHAQVWTLLLQHSLMLGSQRARSTLLSVFQGTSRMLLHATGASVGVRLNARRLVQNL